jgi:hypothetical protein
MLQDVGRCSFAYLKLRARNECVCVLQEMMHPDPAKRPKASKLSRGPFTPPCFSTLIDAKENMGAHGNKAQMLQLVGNGQGSLPGGVKKTVSASAKDGKKKADSKGNRSAASMPTLTFLKTAS